MLNCHCIGVYHNAFCPKYVQKHEVERTIASVTLTLHDGSTIEFDDVNVDSIGPSAVSPGVVGIEFMNDNMRIVHVPFVRFWEVDYR